MFSSSALFLTKQTLRRVATYQQEAAVTAAGLRHFSASAERVWKVYLSGKSLTTNNIPRYLPQSIGQQPCAAPRLC